MSAFLLRSTFACFLAVAGLGVGQHVLDLTKEPHRASPVRTGPVHGRRPGRVEGQQPIQLPLRLTLAALDRKRYVLLTPFVYEVVLSNTGTMPVQFPWSADQQAFNDRVEPLLEADLSLSVHDPSGRAHHIAAAILHGSTSEPGTFTVLRAGETATIRVPGLFSLDPPVTRGLLRSDSSWQVRAILNATAKPGVWAKEIQSENAIAVRIIPASR